MASNINLAVIGQTTSNDVSIAIATAINAGDNMSLIYSLKSGFDSITSFHGISAVSGSDAVSIVNSIFDPLTVAFALHEGELALRNALSAYHEDSRLEYPIILSNMKDSVLAIDHLTYNSLALTIANTLNANNSLVNYLLMDFYSSWGSVDYRKSQFAGVSGSDAPSIARSIYENEGLFNGISFSASALALLNAIEDYHNLDTSVVTFSSAIGSDALNTDANTIIGGINEVGSKIDVLKTTLTITPRSGAYLNKCTMDDNGVYTVGGSVFIGFDPEVGGIALSAMVGLNTLTGYINAMAQCATWQLTYENQDLYVSTTHAGGIAGTMEETGCSPALDFASAGAYCLSVFDNYEYVV